MFPNELRVQQWYYDVTFLKEFEVTKMTLRKYHKLNALFYNSNYNPLSFLFQIDNKLHHDQHEIYLNTNIKKSFHHINL